MEQSRSYAVIPKALSSLGQDRRQKAFAVKQSNGCQAGARQVQAQALQCAGLHTDKPGHTDLSIPHTSSLAMSVHRENGRNASPRCRSLSARNLRAKRNSGRTSKAGGKSDGPSPAKDTISAAWKAFRTTTALSMPYGDAISSFSNTSPRPFSRRPGFE